MKKEKKKKLVEELSKEITAAKGVVLTSFEGLNSEETAELRKKMRRGKVRYRVVKNTLIKRSLTSDADKGLEPYLQGPVALAICQEDPLKPAKIIKDFIAEHTKMKLMAGMIEGKLMDGKILLAVAALPPREVLLSQVFLRMKSPVYGLVNTLSGVLRKLTGSLQAVKEKKEKDKS